MFQMSRDTTINKGSHEDQVVSSLKEHIIRVNNGGESQLITLQSGVSDDWFVYGLGEGSLVNVKPFINPVKFDYGDDTYLIIDLRTSTRWDRATGKPVISNRPLFRRDMVRVLMESVWIGDGPQEILNMGHFQIQIFATWISELFARRFALDAEQQVRISVLAAFYYLCLFTDDDQADLRRFVPIISKVTSTGSTFVIDTLRDVEYIRDLEALLDTIKSTLQTDRLEGVGIDVMITMLSGSWFGPNNAILVGIALEYPPMWNTLLYLSLTDQSVRANGIAKIALRKQRDMTAREYVSIASQKLIRTSTLNLSEV